MKGNKITVFISAVTLLLVFAVMCSFQLNKDEKGILITFGKPQLIEKPGLYFRWPQPIQKLVVLDSRKQLFESIDLQVVTGDNINFIVKIVTVWSVDQESPKTFYEKTGSSTADAESQLGSLVDSQLQSVVRSFTQADFFSVNKKASNLPKIEGSLKNTLNAQTVKNYGITIHSVAFVRNSLHEKNSVAVLARMKEEQNKLAVEIRSRAEKEAQIKRHTADGANAKKIAEATAEAKRIRDEASAKSADLFSSVAKEDQEFVAFLRKLDAIKQIMKTSTTAFFTPDIPPFDLLKKEKPSEEKTAK
ncbi:MAG: hypothetical protein HRT88_04070 [Lentisphaeraceae bacterium]|nr:hypothetical protein [Lentisphaeraceae bacterium]